MSTKFYSLLLGLLLGGGVAALAQQPATNLVLTQAPCNANGILTANFSNLTPPLTVTWYIGANPPIVHSNVTTLSDALTGYTGGPVSVMAVDVNNAAADGFFAGAPPFTYQVSTTAAVCPALGTATAVVTGGTAPYTYQWLDQGTLNVVSTSNPAPLPTGSYDVMITDANGCTYGSMYSYDSISVHAEAPFNFTISTTTAACTNGTATVGPVTGSGVPPYTYQWSNGANTASINNLTAGAYQLTVTDAQGCHRTRTVQVNQSITINANTTVTPATCVQNNGAIMTFASGGVPPYSYLYSNGGTTQGQTNLAPGYYSVQVTDANGCIGSGAAYVNSSSPVMATFSATSSSCTSPTGSATLSISGGQAPYTVTWSTYPAQTGVTASNLAPGNYTFHITDANNCVREGVINIPPVNVISATLTGINPACLAANGAINLMPSGGAAPYTYLWSNSATTQNITGLAAGSYSVQITDAAGCSVTKYKYLEPASPVQIGLAATPTSCIYTADGSVASTVWGGAAPYTYNWTNGQTTANITGLATGNYWLHVTDANGCTASEHTQVVAGSGNACYCTITGKVYHDQNGNCVQDPGEAGIPNIQIHCSGFGYTYTNAAGIYSFQVPTGTYILSETVQSIYPLATCQNNAITVNATASAGCTQTVNFANGINPIHDIHISNWNSNQPVPGNQYYQSCIISNMGTVTESSILAGYHTDGQLNTPSFSPGGIFGGSTNPNWFSTAGNAVPTLAPGNSQSFNVHYNVPTNIPMGTNVAFRDSAVYTAPMSNWLNDYTPWNNVNQNNATVVSSYDPNFKEVNPKGVGPEGNITRADSVIEYMVHFQNLGTYKAQNVVVIDTLDSDLDWTSLRPIYSSHAAKVTIGENGVLKYTFKDINLPAKMHNEPASNGMFTFSIRQKPMLPYGTKITNSAAIYFDYNEPVITNRVLNTISQPTGIENTGKDRERLSFMLYPNPTRDGFTAIVANKTAATASLNISDVSGRVLLAKTMHLQAGQQQIGMSTESLAPGVYFVNLDVDGKKGTQKLVIMK